MRSIRQNICWTGVFIVVLPNLNHYNLSTFIYQSWEKIKLRTKIFQLQEVFAPWHFSKIYEEINMDIKFRGTGELSLIFLMLSLLRQIDIWSWNIVSVLQCPTPRMTWYSSGTPRRTRRSSWSPSSCPRWAVIGGELVTWPSAHL